MNSLTVQLEDLGFYFDKIIDSQQKEWNIELLPEQFQNITIKIQGERYDASINGDFIKGLSNLQDSIYRLYALKKYGTVNLSHLTLHEKKSLILNFHIEKGCTFLYASIKMIAKAISEGFVNMDSKHKAWVLSLLIVAITTGVISFYVVDYKKAEVQAKIEYNGDTQTAEILKENQKTIQQQQELMQNMLDALEGKERLYLAEASKIISSANTSIAKHSIGADQVTIGQKTYSKKELRDLQQYNKQEENFNTVTITEPLVFVEINNENPQSWRVKAKHSPKNRTITLHIDPVNLFQDQTEIDLIWDAVRTHREVVVTYREISNGKKVKNEVDSVRF